MFLVDLDELITIVSKERDDRFVLLGVRKSEPMMQTVHGIEVALTLLKDFKCEYSFKKQIELLSREQLTVIKNVARDLIKNIDNSKRVRVFKLSTDFHTTYFKTIRGAKLAIVDELTCENVDSECCNYTITPLVVSEIEARRLISS